MAASSTFPSAQASSAVVPSESWDPDLRVILARRLMKRPTFLESRAAEKNAELTIAALDKAGLSRRKVKRSLDGLHAGHNPVDFISILLAVEAPSLMQTTVWPVLPSAVYACMMPELSSASGPTSPPRNPQKIHICSTVNKSWELVESHVLDLLVAEEGMAPARARIAARKIIPRAAKSGIDVFKAMSLLASIWKADSKLDILTTAFRKEDPDLVDWYAVLPRAVCHVLNTVTGSGDSAATSDSRSSATTTSSVPKSNRIKGRGGWKGMVVFLLDRLRRDHGMSYSKAEGRTKAITFGLVDTKLSRHKLSEILSYAGEAAARDVVANALEDYLEKDGHLQVSDIAGLVVDFLGSSRPTPVAPKTAANEAGITSSAESEVPKGKLPEHDYSKASASSASMSPSASSSSATSLAAPGPTVPTDSEMSNCKKINLNKLKHKILLRRIDDPSLDQNVSVAKALEKKVTARKMEVIGEIDDSNVGAVTSCKDMSVVEAYKNAGLVKKRKKEKSDQDPETKIFGQSSKIIKLTSDDGLVHSLSVMSSVESGSRVSATTEMRLSDEGKLKAAVVGKEPSITLDAKTENN